MACCTSSIGPTCQHQTSPPDTCFDIAHRIVTSGNHEKHDGVLIDLQTANAIVQVANHLSPVNRAKFEALPVVDAGAVAWRLIGKVSKR